MTEAIIITAIIVGGIVTLAWVALHFGHKAWLEGQAAAGSPEMRIQIDPDWTPPNPEQLRDFQRNVAASVRDA